MLHVAAKQYASEGKLAGISGEGDDTTTVLMRRSEGDGKGAPPFL